MHLSLIPPLFACLWHTDMAGESNCLRNSVQKYLCAKLMLAWNRDWKIVSCCTMCCNTFIWITYIMVIHLDILFGLCTRCKIYELKLNSTYCWLVLEWLCLWRLLVVRHRQDSQLAPALYTHVHLQGLLEYVMYGVGPHRLLSSIWKHKW